RTVTAALRVQGLDQQANFSKYHRLLSRARWSPMLLSRLLLGAILKALVPQAAPVVLLIDETLERRRGRRILYKSWFRDAVRSHPHRACFSLGIRWCCVCVLAPVPWSSRPWALPFFVVPVLAEKTCQKLRKQPRSSTQWAALLLQKVGRWYPDRELVLVGDGAYAVVALVQHCQQAPRPVKLVSRLRLDAVLHDFPGPHPPGRPGRRPKKGPRLPNLAERLEDPQTPWHKATLSWYGGTERTLELATGLCLWYTPRWDPVPLRWVLVRCPQEAPQSFSPTAYFCSDPAVAPEQLLAWFLGRWSIEVTFEELRAHLGFETQRQWAPRALERTTPCLFGLFSLVVLMAHCLHP
ncbi:MAG TPA: transposase, partial [bacterium]|nr:transposase [bacterium]